jgi:hypothetical protein
MGAAGVAWVLLAVIAFPLGLITWLVFWGLLLPSLLCYSDPQIRMGRKASAFFGFGVPLLGACIVIWVAFSIAEPKRPVDISGSRRNQAASKPTHDAKGQGHSDGGRRAHPRPTGFDPRQRGARQAGSRGLT